MAPKRTYHGFPLVSLGSEGTTRQSPFCACASSTGLEQEGDHPWHFEDKAGRLASQPPGLAEMNGARIRPEAGFLGSS